MASLSRSFTGTDGVDINTLSEGWATGTDLEVYSNRARSSIATGFNYYNNTDTVPDTVDQDIQATFITGTSDHTTPWIGGRMKLASTAGDCYFWYYQSAATGWALYIRSGGTNTQLANYVGDAPTTVKTGLLEIRDAAKKGKVDGVERCSSSNNAITASGSWACGTWYATTATGVGIDTFYATDAGGGVNTSTTAWWIA